MGVLGAKDNQAAPMKDAAWNAARQVYITRIRGTRRDFKRFMKKGGRLN
ncbi:hypothetical protein N0M98_31185 [Paenibacillus doosanensis]|nr:hypothetical protein [Paenibacillus doosanensis]